MAQRAKRSLQEIVTELSTAPRKVQARGRLSQAGSSSSQRGTFDRSPSEDRLSLEDDLAELRLSSPEKEFRCEEDPEWVAEYAPDIYSKLAQDEEDHHFFADYMQDQPELGPEERAIAVDWLVEVQMKYPLRTATLFLAVSLLDAYLALKEVRRDTLQLLVVAALWAAAKFEEIDPPELGYFVELTQQACSKSVIRAMEAKLLTAVEFRLCRPTAAHFADRYLKSHGCSEAQGAVIAYLLELALVDFNMLRYTPSEQVSAAALVSARLTGERTPEPCLARTEIPIRKHRVARCGVDLCRLLQEAPTWQWQAVRRKFLRSPTLAVAAAIRDLEV